MNSQYNESNMCQLCNTSQRKDSWTENLGRSTLQIDQSSTLIFLAWGGGWGDMNIKSVVVLNPNYNCTY